MQLISQELHFDEFFIILSQEGKILQTDVAVHCIVSSEAQFETWWWPSERAETCSSSNKYYTTLLVVFDCTTLYHHII